MESRIPRQASWALAVALLASAALGCARDERESAASIGGPRSACELPVTFEVVGGWKAKPLGQADSGGWYHFSNACKLELGTGKEAVELTVDVDSLKGDNPRKVVGDHDGEGVSNLYGEYMHNQHVNESMTVAGQPAAEMDYELQPPSAVDPSIWVRKFAVVAPKDTIVLEVKGHDPGGEERTRQVYDRVKSTMRATS
ncbi:lipoprotein [Streptomyces sp. NPDC090442]|uniref:lipoprotein n=1 Tax=Streptomyces sp. NPDC090442 TaxID=3365962 RepID=UPI0037FD73CE